MANPKTSLTKFKDCLQVPPVLHPQQTDDPVPPAGTYASRSGPTALGTAAKRSVDVCRITARTHHRGLARTTRSDRMDQRSACRPALSHHRRHCSGWLTKCAWTQWETSQPDRGDASTLDRRASPWRSNSSDERWLDRERLPLWSMHHVRLYQRPAGHVALVSRSRHGHYQVQCVCGPCRTVHDPRCRGSSAALARWSLRDPLTAPGSQPGYGSRWVAHWPPCCIRSKMASIQKREQRQHPSAFKRMGHWMRTNWAGKIRCVSTLVKWSRQRQPSMASQAATCTIVIFWSTRTTT